MGKAAALNDSVTDTGVKFDKLRVKGYIEEYLPREYLESSSGRDLIRRASETQGGKELIQAVAKITFQRMMTGNFNFNDKALGLGVTGIKLVECGFARFPGITTDDSAVVDEPLAYLAAWHWINTRQDIFKQHYQYNFFTELFMPDSQSGQGLEFYLAYCLAHKFQDFTPLSDLFAFIEKGTSTDLVDKRARLVSRWVDADGNLCVSPVSCPFLQNPGTEDPKMILKSPSHILCYTSRMFIEDGQVDGDVTKWLLGELNAPFLFPSDHFGPDIMMCLELEGSNEYIWVAVRFKLKSKQASPLLPRLISSVTPAQFWRNSALQSGLPNAYIPPQECSKNFLPNVPFCSLLRVIFTYPLDVSPDDCTKALNSMDEDSHDLASVSFAALPSNCDIILQKYKQDIKRQWKSTGKERISIISPAPSRRNPTRSARPKPYDSPSIGAEFDEKKLVTEYTDIEMLSRPQLVAQLRLFCQFEETVINNGRPSKKLRSKSIPAGSANLSDLRDALNLSAAWYKSLQRKT
ncbi:hypothetical protein H0H81_003450 [Sphagnurus paluster]|uniref:Uncharacterized protein n=1 Tax=Sphagnurus paluster TaxID=117069 RepID=A0A9P7KHL5_9AGAR|nr:hypothetical protein H0H81_003450 [Sphagnurus paluster]